MMLIGGVTRLPKLFSGHTTTERPITPKCLDDLIIRAAGHLAEKFSPGSYGRRVYFPETAKRMEETFQPIIEAFEGKDFEYFKGLLNHTSDVV